MAVALPRHRLLDHPVSLQDVPELLPLVLPALVAVEQGSSHLPFPSSERVLHPLADLREVGTRRYAVADDPPAVEVHYRRQVELPVWELELRDELPVRPLGREASRKQVRRYLTYLSPSLRRENLLYPPVARFRTHMIGHANEGLQHYCLSFSSMP